MSDSKPDVSVIIASRNRLWSLPEAIASCRSASCRTEIVVVDDGSTDGTWQWLQSREDVISLRTEGWGKCWATNAGFAVSSGEFVRFLDSDDWLLPGANDRQLEVARATQADAVLSGHVYIDDESGATRTTCCSPTDDYLAQYIEMVSSSNDCSCSAYLLRRAFIEGIPHRQEFPWDDIMFAIEVFLANPKVAACDFPTLMYRQHNRDLRLSNTTGLDQVQEVWRTIAMYKRALALMREKSNAWPRRVKAVQGALWLEARKLANWNLPEATAVFEWILEQDRTFAPPVGKMVGRLYRAIGVTNTERLALARRTLMRTLKKKAAISGGLS